MGIELTLSVGGLVEFLPGLPSGYKGRVIPGSTLSHAKTSIIQIAAQELAAEDYSICFVLGKILAKATGWSRIEKTGLYCLMMLKNGIRKNVDSIGRFHIREGQYASFYANPGKCKILFDHDGEYSLLKIYYAPKLIEELIPYFPELDTDLKSNKAILLPGKSLYSMPAVRQIAHQLIYCPYDKMTSRFYFDIKVREFLFELLVNIYRKTPEEQNFTPWEISKLHQAKELLASYIPHKPPTVRLLSKQVMLSIFKLKKGFRQYFNAGIFEWLIDEKMQEAKRLVLESNKPIKEISSLVGYSRTTNFITAFRRRFGITPGALRRK